LSHGQVFNHIASGGLSGTKILYFSIG